MAALYERENKEANTKIAVPLTAEFIEYTQAETAKNPKIVEFLTPIFIIFLPKYFPTNPNK